MHLYIITVRRGFSKWKLEPVTRNKDNTMHKRKQDNNLQNTIQTHDRVTRSPLKTGDDNRYIGRASSSCSTTTIRHVTLGSHAVLVYEWGKELEVQHHACKILLNLHKQGVNSWYFGPISYWVCAGRCVSNFCIFLFALHKTKGIRRLYASSRRVKPRFICSSLCRKKITRGGSHFPIKYSSAVGRSRLFHLPNWWLGGINSPLHYINKPMQLLYCQDKYVYEYVII